MKNHPFIKTVSVLFAALFLSSQVLAQGHNAENEHSHDDVVCAACVVAVQQVVVEPDVKLVVPVTYSARAEWDDIVTKAAPRSFDGRAPPPRGPPTL